MTLIFERAILYKDMFVKRCKERGLAFSTEGLATHMAVWGPFYSFFDSETTRARFIRLLKTADAAWISSDGHYLVILRLGATGRMCQSVAKTKTGRLYDTVSVCFIKNPKVRVGFGWQRKLVCEQDGSVSFMVAEVKKAIIKAEGRGESVLRHAYSTVPLLQEQKEERQPITLQIVKEYMDILEREA